MRHYNRSNLFMILLLAGHLAFTIIGCSKSTDPLQPHLSSSEGISAGTRLDSDQRIYVPGEVLVVLTDEAEASVGGRLFDGLPLTPIREKTYNWGILRRLLITDGTSVEDMCERLKPDPRVRIIEPNYYVHFAEAPYTPNDPMWESDSDPDDDPRNSVWEQ